MKKPICVLMLVALAAMSSTSLANAWPGSSPPVYVPLTVDVNVAENVIYVGESQLITATTNKAGFGLLVVLQPTTGSWTNPWWWSFVPSEVKTLIGHRIVSWTYISMGSADSKDLTFPEGFTGLNGEPNTLVQGKYKVIFIFISFSGGYSCKWIQKDFDCGSWFVVPEFPLGTCMALAVPIVAFAGYATYKKRKVNS